MSSRVAIRDVARALMPPLPGLDAQLRMGTKPRPAPREGYLDEPPRQAAVLVLLYPRDGRLFLPLTRRTERVTRHKAEIALPGGAQERGDPSLWHTAVRETFEEIGVEPHTIHRLGGLTSLYVPSSHFNIHPFVGHVRHPPTFTLDAQEVDEVIEFPLQTILDPRSHSEELRHMRGSMVRVPYYRYEQHVIWGATAMILSELEVALTTALEAG